MANDTYQLNVLTSASGQFAENVLHYSKATSAPDTDPFTIAKSIITQWQSHAENDFLACIPNDSNLIGFKCKRINNGGGPTAVVPDGANGTFGGSTIITSSAACLLFAYSNGTRFFAGRLFLPFLGDGAYAGNEPQTGYETAVGVFNTVLGTALTVSGVAYSQVIWSRKHVTAYTITGREISLKVGTQRKRLVPIM